jgi:hypothetical protein
MLASVLLVAEVVMASRLTSVNLVTVNDVLDGHVRLDPAFLDRIYLWVPPIGRPGTGGSCS